MPDIATTVPTLGADRCFGGSRNSVRRRSGPNSSCETTSVPRRPETWGFGRPPWTNWFLSMTIPNVKGDYFYTVLALLGEYPTATGRIRDTGGAYLCSVPLGEYE